MALKQTDVAKGITAYLVSERAGTPAVQHLPVLIAANTTLVLADITEFAVLPAFHKIVGVRIVTDAMGTGITAKIGFLSGEAGSTEGTRTLGSDIAATADVATAGDRSVASAAAINLPSVDYHRGIGIQFSADVAGTGTGKRVTVILETVPPSNG